MDINVESGVLYTLTLQQTQWSPVGLTSKYGCGRPGHETFHLRVARPLHLYMPLISELRTIRHMNYTGFHNRPFLSMLTNQLPLYIRLDSYSLNSKGFQNSVMKLLPTATKAMTSISIMDLFLEYV